jgi:hypothetical protein
MPKITALIGLMAILSLRLVAQDTESLSNAPAKNNNAAQAPVDAVQSASMDEVEKDPETQRLIEEAKQKIVKERAEKIAAEKKAREEEARP